PDSTLFPVANSFAAVVMDDAMDGEGIFKGDYVIVQQKNDLSEQSLVFALAGAQQLVRRLEGTGELRYLVAANRYYKKVPVIEGRSDVALMGEVVGVMRAL